MNYDLIKQKVLEVYRTCKIGSFPIDCLTIYDYYGLKAHPYSTLEEPLKSYCLSMSEDAFIYNHIVCYNDDVSYPIGRIRFSLMHELGHHVLHHSETRTSAEEFEANAFASYLLAPRIAIHYANCKNCNDIVKIFDISVEAATIAFDDYRKWRRKYAHKISTIDKLTYYHFYNKEQDMFIWNHHICKACNQEVYNTLELTCCDCNHLSKQIKMTERLSYIRTSCQTSRSDCELKHAEQYWLYGDNY